MTEILHKNENPVPGPSNSKTAGKGYKTTRLRFLTALLEATGYTVYTYAHLESNSPSAANNIKRMLLADDMKVSKAKSIVENLGYKLDIILKQKPENEGDGRHEVPNYVLPESLENRKKLRDKNLQFLIDFMQENYLTQRQLAKDLGVSAGGVQAWLDADDIRISWLYKIHEIYDTVLQFKIEDKEVMPD